MGYVWTSYILKLMMCASLCCQERLVMSILPQFLVLEMIGDMAVMEDYLLPQQLHKIYIHHYKDVR